MATRRLVILSSHLHPIAHSRSRSSSPVSASFCSADKELLTHSNGTTHHIDCVFCKIIQGESPAVKLYEDDACLCILDTNPLSRGHSLIVPKSHFSSLDLTPPSVIAAMCSKVPLITKAIIKATGADSFNLLVNNGAAAGQVIFHTHIHIIPRKASDCLWPSESLWRRSLKMDQDTSQLADQVRENLSNICEDSKGQESSLP